MRIVEPLASEKNVSINVDVDEGIFVEVILTDLYSFY